MIPNLNLYTIVQQTSYSMYQRIIGNTFDAEKDSDKAGEHKANKMSLYKNPENDMVASEEKLKVCPIYHEKCCYQGVEINDHLITRHNV